jgi:hypothetical protein
MWINGWGIFTLFFGMEKCMDQAEPICLGYLLKPVTDFYVLESPEC